MRILRIRRNMGLELAVEEGGVLRGKPSRAVRAPSHSSRDILHVPPLLGTSHVASLQEAFHVAPRLVTLTFVFLL